jgi:hypothetical protein
MGDGRDLGPRPPRRFGEDELIEFCTPPTTSGWYGIINSGDDGGGMIDRWGDAEYWDSVSGWRRMPYCASWRSVETFQSEAEAMDWGWRNC